MSEALKMSNRLRVIETLPGGKNKHRQHVCVCECGERRTVRVDRLSRGEITECAKCSIATAREAGRFQRKRLSDAERIARDVFGEYRGNARRKSLRFELNLDDVRRLIAASCHYCGERPAKLGIDRRDNTEGYTISNSVPCCSICNYAKREMSAEEFLSWITKVFHHVNTEGFLQRDRSILLCLDQQPDGHGIDYAGCH